MEIIVLFLIECCRFIVSDFRTFENKQLENFTNLIRSLVNLTDLADFNLNKKNCWFCVNFKSCLPLSI